MSKFVLYNNICQVQYCPKVERLIVCVLVDLTDFNRDACCHGFQFTEAYRCNPARWLNKSVPPRGSGCVPTSRDALRLPIRYRNVVRTGREQHR